MMANNALSFDPATHQYRVDGETILSVTQILKACGIIDDTWYTKESAQRGQAVHLATQLFDESDLDWDSVSPEITGYLDAYRKFRQEVIFEVDMIEQPIYSATYRFAGTPDRTGILNGKNVVIDIKSGQKAKWHRLQTAGYALLLDRPVERYVLYLLKTGSYRLDQHRSSSDTSVFLAALSVASWSTK
jgi:hypothetical protein